MHRLLPLCLVLSAALLRDVACLNNVINCYPCDKCLPRCQAVLPSQCQSGKTVKCDCCDVCLVYLKEGDVCKFFYDKNAECGPGLICKNSRCVRRNKARPTQKTLKDRDYSWFRR